MKVIVQNLVVEYKDRGTGPVILFLHGWKDTMHTFDEISRLLSNTYRIIALDLPGFGASELPKGIWELSDYVAFVKAFLEKRHISPVVIVGHSFGGRIVIKGLVSGILGAQKVVLIASAGIARTKTVRSLFFGIVAKVGKILTLIPPFCFWRMTLRKKLYASTGSDYFGAGALKDTFLKVIREDLSEDAKKITIPVLLIWGSSDKATPLSDGEKFARMIPRAKLQTYVGAGHFVHQERAFEVASVIKHFVEQ